MRLLLASLAAVGAVTACTTSHVDDPTVVTPPSISPTSTAGVAPPGPCDVLTPAQLQSAFGGTVSAGGKSDSTARSQCTWTVKGGNLEAAGSVTVSFPSIQSSQAFYSAETAQLGAQKIDELGDAAFYDLQHNALTVLVGERQFVVQADFGSAVDAASLQVDLIAAAQHVETHF